MGMTNKTTFWAFISYSHRDSQWCHWLHKKLESFVIPSDFHSVEKGLGKHLYPIFPDRDELPGSADLGENISAALTHSKSLLVICSPRSAASLWVNEEVINFQKLSPGKPIIALLIEGRTDTADATDNCLGPALRSVIERQGTAVIDARQQGQENDGCRQAVVGIEVAIL